MGKDRANKGTQQTRMDRYTAQSSGASLQKDPPGPLQKGAEPTGAQILAAIESSSLATQTQIAAIAVDVNLLRADLKWNDGTGMPESLRGGEWWETPRQRKCVLQRVEVPDAIVPAVEAE
ncbi:hypothetical protein NDU88_005584 [Pleurodeles waltl]|uniref:Uncharacterized protein n=1 Tax=Pleurodeles waltl TaxID=8319 RepID=A0AAV7TXP5_PLEWA|nr:hypothetical protein NDU88_005584 [Pleurodeles waltl]